MRGGADEDLDVLAAGHRDRFGASLDRDHLRAPAVFGALGIFEVEVGDVGVEVGEAPGDALVVPDDHSGESGEGVARDVEGALRCDFAAVQTGLQPHTGLGDTEVRIVGQQRFAALGVIAGDHPGV